jgi:hypothetical protein
MWWAIKGFVYQGGILQTGPHATAVPAGSQVQMIRVPQIDTLVAKLELQQWYVCCLDLQY